MKQLTAALARDLSEVRDPDDYSKLNRTQQAALKNYQALIRKVAKNKALREKFAKKDVFFIPDLDGWKSTYENWNISGGTFFIGETRRDIWASGNSNIYIGYSSAEIIYLNDSCTATIARSESWIVCFGSSKALVGAAKEVDLYQESTGIIGTANSVVMNGSAECVVQSFVGSSSIYIRNNNNLLVLNPDIQLKLHSESNGYYRAIESVDISGLQDRKQTIPVQQIDKDENMSQTDYTATITMENGFLTDMVIGEKNG